MTDVFPMQGQHVSFAAQGKHIRNEGDRRARRPTDRPRVAWLQILEEASTASCVCCTAPVASPVLSTISLWIIPQIHAGKVRLKRLDDEMLAVQKVQSAKMLRWFESVGCRPCPQEYEKEVQKLKKQFQVQQAPFIEARDKARLASAVRLQLAPLTDVSSVQVLAEKEGSEDPVTGTPKPLMPLSSLPPNS